MTADAAELLKLAQSAIDEVDAAHWMSLNQFGRIFRHKQGKVEGVVATEVGLGFIVVDDDANLVRASVNGLVKAVCSARERDAFAVLNDARSWCNIITDCPVSPESAERMKSTVDATGTDGKNSAVVVVPLHLHRDAILASVSGLLVVDYLEDPSLWFVTTGADGLVWSEEAPLALRAEINDDGAVVVRATEKRGFGCTDPRAIVGAVVVPDKVAA